MPRSMGAAWPAFLAALLMALVLVSGMFWARPPSAIAVSPPPVPALIIVDTRIDDSVNGDGVCSLRKAISNTNARKDTTSGDCAPGTGNDTIMFALSGKIMLGSGLPAIQNTLTIDGAGQSVMIDGANMDFQVLVVNLGATLHLNSLTVAHGGASASAFAAVVNQGTLTITESTFSGNRGQTGSAIYNNHTMTITDSTFSQNGNGSQGESAAIFNQSGARLSVSNSTFSGNSAPDGGAIFNSGGTTLSVANSTFSGNRASNGGAIFNDGTLTVTNSTFSGNSTTSDGGAIGNGGTLTVANSTFSGNSANQGGAVFNEATLSVANSTFSGNSAGAEGGGAIATFGTLAIAGSILANSPGGGECHVNSPIDLGFNIADDASCGFHATMVNGQSIGGDSVNPLLDPRGLQNNGGPTQTIGLQANSPAIDAIPKADCPPTDQRGFPRGDPEDKPTPTCDIGAFESGETVAATITLRPNPLSFGSQRKSSTHTKSVSVRAPRSNRVPVSLVSFSLSPGDYAIDSFVKDPCTPGESLSPGASCAIGIDFTPSAKTRGLSDVGQLQIQTNAKTINPKAGIVTLKGGGK